MKKQSDNEPMVSVTVTPQKWGSRLFEKVATWVFWIVLALSILGNAYRHGYANGNADGYIHGYIDGKYGRPPMENTQKFREFRAEFSPKQQILIHRTKGTNR